MRRASKRDANESMLVEAARNMGWQLWMLETPCDWLGYFRGRWLPIEIKMPKGSFTPMQKIFIDRCAYFDAPVLVWRSLEDIQRSCHVYS